MTEIEEVLQSGKITRLTTLPPVFSVDATRSSGREYLAEQYQRAIQRGEKIPGYGGGEWSIKEIIAGKVSPKTNIELNRAKIFPRCRLRMRYQSQRDRLPKGMTQAKPSTGRWWSERRNPVQARASRNGMNRQTLHRPK